MGWWPTWRTAWETALYGPDGFYRRAAPAAHFRTSVHASSAYGLALARLAREAGVRTVVDVGAGRGELLTVLAAAEPRWELVGVDVGPRPDGLPTSIAWRETVPEGLKAVLVIANEWLDDVPCDVVEVGPDAQPHLLHVDPATGEERPGAVVGAASADWLARWWPLDGAPAGARAEVGRSRDDAWAGVVGAVRDGLVLAVDYAHDRAARPPDGTLAGYRDGRLVAPVPAGSSDVTAHVALDACAAAGVRAGATATVLTTQREALRSLGVDASLPSRDLALRDPRTYASALVTAGEAAELLDPGGLGGFGWLVQAVHREIPRSLAGLRGRVTGGTGPGGSW